MVTVNFCAKLILIPPRWYEAPTVVDEGDPLWPLVVNPPPTPPQTRKWTADGQGLLLLRTEEGRTETDRSQGTDGDK